MCEETKKERIIWIIPAIIILLVVSSCWATWYFLVDVDKRGTFGDMFGVTNAFFSGLAFGGVIYAIILQKRELELQRKELKDTREVLKDQKQQLEAQNTTLKKQNFENTFFQLLRLHDEVTNSTECKVESRTFNGRACFRIFYNRFSTQYKTFNPANQTEKKRISLAYLKLYEEYQNEVSRYFRNLYAIFKFLESSGDGNPELYVNLIRVQLSDNELLLLFYHSLSDIDKDELKPLIEKYALFKSLPSDKLLMPVEHEKLYDSGAFTYTWTVT